MSHRQRRLLLLRQQASRLDDVFDLPPIDLDLRQRLQVRVAQPTLQVSHMDKSLPYMEPARGVQGRIVDGEMDSRLKGRVKVVDTVAREEHDASVILELP